MVTSGAQQPHSEQRYTQVKMVERIISGGCEVLMELGSRMQQAI